MSKLWQKSHTNLNQVVESFETKGDLVQDQKLIPYDIQGSIAHAKMLQKIGILSQAELTKLLSSLDEILNLYQKGQFNLTEEDEDMHTKIENFLSLKCGRIGQKIHTGRSRNDQILTTLRLYTKEQLKLVKMAVKNLVKLTMSYSKSYHTIAIPGFTHMQKAMPTTLGTWFGSFHDSFSDDLIHLDMALKLNNQSPLGSGAGFGVPLNLDKKLTARLLKFSTVQQNPIYCQNSRIKIEASTLSALVSVLMTINKLASDILLFTTSEFNFFTADDSISTGSSIMPQKKNLDLAELLRSKVHLVLGNYVQTISLGSNLISGYNRDFQDSKKPLTESFEITLASLEATTILLKNLKPNIEVLKKAMTPELYATEQAYDLVKKGVPFREAYQIIGKQYRKGGGDKNEEKN